MAEKPIQAHLYKHAFGSKYLYQRGEVLQFARWHLLMPNFEIWSNLKVMSILWSDSADDPTPSVFFSSAHHICLRFDGFSKFFTFKVDSCNCHAWKFKFHLYLGNTVLHLTGDNNNGTFKCHLYQSLKKFVKMLRARKKGLTK